MTKFHRAFVALGANLDDPAAQLAAAVKALGELPHTTLVACSRFYASAPVGYADQPDFVNAVAAVDTGLTPDELLQGLLQIEAAQGRERTFRNAPRTLDLDVLLYDSITRNDAHLVIPHPRMHERAFVLVPLAEIAPDTVIPGLGPVTAFLGKVASQTLHPLG
ncbi:2-amino-4-hydroxy-6-hydroxymethyldihydropteridine diphosphokinase [Silvimonas iriomotensis]|uniref:2-amino-4-hydroxy-6-hydroxymethyldihydropteridine pyrophosphokinase n=1 Tax=Silvimonas iriomotensis TaxID=449662 RepID=A0ABQ2PCA4_9NEIS|nr:2-amino-4-hydroxy-6-hydroxymethyldihydropteridine diphosphokinase [Silvimonas iriomotensis]GGP22844.1 2-amino-4-hydroxy-6-hydroxymethyldihydropteridine diphosphokinase [Silvimonas iriomotensis]